MSDISLGLGDPRDTTRAILALESAVEELREQLDRERQRADTAERQLAGVEAELVEARAKAAGLRCLLERQASPRTERPHTRWQRLQAWRRSPA